MPTTHAHAPADALRPSPAPSAATTAPSPSPLYRQYRPLTRVTSPVARLALCTLLCPSVGLALTEQDAAEAVGLPCAQSDQGAAPRPQSDYGGQVPGSLAEAGAGVGGGGAESRSSHTRAREVVEKVLDSRWPKPAHREWVIRAGAAGQGPFSSSSSSSHQETEGGGSPSPEGMPALCSQLYVQQAEGEMRVAVVVVSDP